MVVGGTSWWPDGIQCSGIRVENPDPVERPVDDVALIEL